MNSYQDMAIRQTNAETRFVDAVVANGFTRDEAATVARVYNHIGVLAFDAVDGQYYTRHGALMESTPMRNAIAGADAALAARKVSWKRRR